MRLRFPVFTWSTKRLRVMRRLYRSIWVCRFLTKSVGFINWKDFMRPNHLNLQWKISKRSKKTLKIIHMNRWLMHLTKYHHLTHIPVTTNLWTKHLRVNSLSRSKDLKLLMKKKKNPRRNQNRLSTFLLSIKSISRKNLWRIDQKLNTKKYLRKARVTRIVIKSNKYPMKSQYRLFSERKRKNWF